MTLPFEPPLDPMLARVASDVPDDEGWAFEPKWDGFRALVFVDPPSVRIDSRDGRDLQRYFPEVEQVMAESVTEPAVVDGEIVLPTEEGLDFDLLLQRIHPAASRVKLLAEQTPTTFVCFDLLARGAQDLRAAPFSERRVGLEALLPPAGDPRAIARTQGPRALATATSDDPEVARSWFNDLEAVGLDGVIAKRLDGPYMAGERVMLKIKHRHTADCVIGGYRAAKSGNGVGSLLLGLYDDRGTFHYVGFSAAFPAPQRRELLERLEPLHGESFGGGRAPGGQSRWNRGQDQSWVSVKPVLVCEVAYDHLQGVRFRHGAQWVRWRPDKQPRDCTFEQLPERHRPRPSSPPE